MVKKKFNPLFLIYIASFLFSIHTALTAYVNSSFLSLKAPSNIIGIIYALGALVTIVGLSFLPRLTSKFGNYKTSLSFFFLSAISIFVFAYTEIPLLAILAFVFYFASNNMVFFTTDIFVEHYTKKENTGHRRGLYLTLINLAWVGAPLGAGYISSTLGYPALYGIALSYIIFSGYVISRSCREFEDRKYIHTPIFKSLTMVHKNKDIELSMISYFILYFFYSWMVIYTPLYLHGTVGLNWGEIGLIFTIMLLPFVLLEYPLGVLADKYFGEKEILIMGFAIAGTATIIFSMIDSAPVLVWAFILFMTRVGAAMIESMTEIYFFKKIKEKDANLLSVFRNANPLAFTFGPIIASVLLLMISYQSLFLVLGIIVWSGVIFAHKIHDTR